MAAQRRSNAAQKNRANKQSSGRGAARTAPERQSIKGTAAGDIVGVLLFVCAAAMVVSIVSPSSAIVTHATGQILELCFGVGAILAPLALAVFAATFFIKDEGPVSGHLALGVCIAALAILGMLSLDQGVADTNPDLVLSADNVIARGGYVGGAIAYGLLLSVGKIVGNIILVGVIAVAVVVCGFSVSGLVERAGNAWDDVKRNREEARERRLNELGSYDDYDEYGAYGQEPEPYADGAYDMGPAPLEPEPVAEGSGNTTFLGSRKTTVLRRDKNNAPVEGIADRETEKWTAPAPTKLLDRLRRHPDLDVDKTRPAQPLDVEDEPELGHAVEASGQTERIDYDSLAAGQDGVSQPAQRVESPIPDHDIVPPFLANASGSKSRRATKRRGTKRQDMGGSPAPRKSGDREATCATEVKKSAPQILGTAAETVKAAGGASRPGDDAENYELPPFSMLSSNPNSAASASSREELDQTKARLQDTLQEFGLTSRVVDYVSGPLVTTFRVEMGEGERVSKIRNLEDDIALTLAAEKVRIFAPIPGTSFVGIEIPNKTRQNVHLGDVLPYAKGGPLEVAIGRDSAGKPVIADIAKMPHMLVAGTTGSGKSVMINSMIMSLLMRTTPKQVRLIMIDPKRVEFTCYNGLPHLYVPVVTEPKQAASALSWAVSEMERRLKVFQKAGARDIKVYNRMCVSGKLAEMDNPPEPMPFLVVVIDELSDLMMVAGQDVEASIVRIAQLARAAGIHLIIATQRPSANVVTGLIKSNIDTRAALKVSSGVDSRVILDETGAERLLGHGDMLFKDRGLTPKRVLGCYTSDNEINDVVEFLRGQGEPDYHEEILSQVVPGQVNGGGGMGSDGDSDDPLVWEAAQIVVESQLGSTSGLQRRLKVGYARAGRIMDLLESKGVVGPPDGSKPREVLLNMEELEDLRAQEAMYKEV